MIVFAFHLPCDSGFGSEAFYCCWFGSGRRMLGMFDVYSFLLLSISHFDVFWEKGDFSVGRLFRQCDDCLVKFVKKTIMERHRTVEIPSPLGTVAEMKQSPTPEGSNVCPRQTGTGQTTFIAAFRPPATQAFVPSVPTAGAAIAREARTLHDQRMADVVHGSTTYYSSRRRRIRHRRNGHRCRWHATRHRR